MKEKEDLEGEPQGELEEELTGQLESWRDSLNKISKDRLKENLKGVKKS